MVVSSHPVSSSLSLQDFSIHTKMPSLEQICIAQLSDQLASRTNLIQHLQDPLYLSLPSQLHQTIINISKPTLEDYEKAWKALNIDPLQPTLSLVDLRQLEPYLSNYFSMIDQNWLQERILPLWKSSLSSQLPKQEDNCIVCLKLIFERIFQNKREIVLVPDSIGFPRFEKGITLLNEIVGNALSQAAKNLRDVHKITIRNFHFNVSVFEMLKATGKEIDARESKLNFSKNVQRIQFACLVLLFLAGTIAAAVGSYYFFLFIHLDLITGFLCGGGFGYIFLGGFVPTFCLDQLFSNMQENRNRTLYYSGCAQEAN